MLLIKEVKVIWIHSKQDGLNSMQFAKIMFLNVQCLLPSIPLSQYLEFVYLVCISTEKKNTLHFFCPAYRMNRVGVICYFRNFQMETLQYICCLHLTLGKMRLLKAIYFFLFLIINKHYIIDQVLIGQNKNHYC